MAKKPPFGTIEYALHHATRELGVDEIERITGHSRSAIYRGTNSDDPLGLGWFTVDMAIEISSVLIASGKAEYFSSAIRQLAEQKTQTVMGDSEPALVLCANIAVVLADLQMALAVTAKDNGKIDGENAEKIVSDIQKIIFSAGRMRETIFSESGKMTKQLQEQ
ncbi:MAG: hypothetical protein OEW37_09580 [Rhodospirillaceae bacterium]|nr:hypothetical protein [Rhodospirillaceae bacterium]